MILERVDFDTNIFPSVGILLLLVWAVRLGLLLKWRSANSPELNGKRMVFVVAFGLGLIASIVVGLSRSASGIAHYLYYCGFIPYITFMVIEMIGSLLVRISGEQTLHEIVGHRISNSRVE